MDSGLALCAPRNDENKLAKKQKKPKETPP
jgi:hypothetical protein